MSDLSAETRALLERARGGDGLPPARRATMRRRLASTVGVAAPLGATASAAASATAWAAKGLAVIGVVGAAHFAGVAAAPPAASPGSARSAPAFVPIAQPSAPPAPVPAAPAIAAPVLAAPVLASPVLAAPAFVQPARAARALPAPAPAAPIERPDPLTAEVRLLATARRAVDAGDAARALDVLDDHDRQFAYGALAPEAAALRVDALCAAGRTGDAEDAARRFVARFPASPLARRFLSTCALHFTPSVTP